MTILFLALSHFLRILDPSFQSLEPQYKSIVFPFSSSVQFDPLFGLNKYYFILLHLTISCEIVTVGAVDISIQRTIIHSNWKTSQISINQKHHPWFKALLPVIASKPKRLLSFLAYHHVLDPKVSHRLY